MEEQSNRPHRKQKEKKQAHSGSSNPKANTFANPGRFLKQAGRSHDVAEKRLHVPLVDRLPEEAPPLVVGVVGPPQVGKTTLIKSLIRRYTKQTLSAPTGPLTVVTSKRRRLTFIECPAESLAAMIDIAKIVDIVLLMIDGKYGFEMETMEFLNILSSTGMPGNVFGILTHLDLFKKQDTLRAQKKRLKHRFWSELYQGAKLFYLSGVVNGRYPDREILNLSRFLSVMKNPRPLVWRNSHSYCLADRFLDITPPTDIEENSKCDRTVALYGYLRGTNLPAQGARAHIPGLGDLGVSRVEQLVDPCPTPHTEDAIAKATGKSKSRRLGEKQKVLYAPMSDVGGVLVDKDAVYIDVRTSTFDPDADGAEYRGLGEQLVMGLQGDRNLLGKEQGSVRLFGDGESTTQRRRRPVDAKDLLEDELIDSGSEDEGIDLDYDEDESDNMEPFEDDALGNESNDSYQFNGANVPNGLRGTIGNDKDNDELIFEDSDSESGSQLADLRETLDDAESSLSGVEDDQTLNWKDNLREKARKMHGGKSALRSIDLAKLMYDMTLEPSEAAKRWRGEATRIDTEDTNEEDVLFRQKPAGGESTENRMIPTYDYNELAQKWTKPENLELLQMRFAQRHPLTGANTEGVAGSEDEDEDFGGSDVDDDDDEGDGEFEDLETGETNETTKLSNSEVELDLDAERERNARRKEELKLRFEEEDKDGFVKADKVDPGKPEGDDEAFGVDDWYDAQKSKIQKQLDINRAAFDDMDEQSRIRAEGYRAGSYVRLVFENVPYEFTTHFNPRNPIIIGGINPTEDRFGYVQVRIKRHRWHQKILKTNDPLIFSLGWRRFQTLPLYSISDSRTRNRMLKYTPEHMHCFGTFYGPLIAPNTGFCCVQSLSNKNAGFRLAATGVVLNVDESTDIVKKLKLKGFPHKVFKNTAIIRDMFASELEIAKFKSGNLKTVSGIRGMIKGRAGNQYPDGYVRAGFEDKILKSDIVFLSSWVIVKPRQFYMPVTNLLLPPSGSDDEDNTWKGMRLTGEVRYELGQKTPRVKDSEYGSIERSARHFNPLRVPRKLAADLPFKSQIAQMKPQQKETYMQKRAVVLGGEEKRARDLMQKVMTLRNEKVAKRQAAQERRKEPYRKRVAENLEKKEAREKREKDEYWQREGKKRKYTEGQNGIAKKKQRVKQ